MDAIVQNPLLIVVQQEASDVNLEKSSSTSAQAVQSPPAGHSLENTSTSTFKEFFTDRELEKKALYMKVVFFSGLLMLLSAVPLGIGSTLLSFTDVPTKVLSQTMVVVGSLWFSLGLCSASTVPVEEFDIEEQLYMRPRLRLAISLSLGLVKAAVGALMSCLPPYGPSIPLGLCGLWIAAHELCYDRWPLLLKISIGLLLLAVSIVHLNLSQVFLPEQCATNVSGIFSNFCLDMLQNPTKLKVWIPLMCILSAVILLGVCALLAYFLSKHASKQQQPRSGQPKVLQKYAPEIVQHELQQWPSGWATTVLISTLYLFLVLAASVSFFNGLAAALTSGLSFANHIGFIGCTVVFLAPLVFLLFFGKKKAFSLLARYFEFDLARQQKDGALMASLVLESSSVFEKEAQDVWWVKRKQEDLALKPQKPDANHIERNFWAKGSIVRSVAPGDAAKSGRPSEGGGSSGGGSSGGGSGASQLPLELTVLVDMKSDKNRTWHERYKAGAALERGKHPATAFWVDEVDEAESFYSWVYRNFNFRDLPPLDPVQQDNFSWMSKFISPKVGSDSKSTAEEVRVVGLDSAARTATLLVTIPRSRTSEKGMMRWAKDSDNFRSFDWENRKQDLFSKSPRELASVDEKDFLYSLSHPRSIVTNADKLDFFVSHSWEDKGVVNSYTLKLLNGAEQEVKETKYDIVKRFMEGQRAALKRYPLLWLDKVCINQNNSAQAISVLPIIIGGCNQMLILLSSSYLKRLWCVWELFTLFTFCNKELALERVVVLPISDFPTGSEEANASHFSFNLDEAHCFDPNEELKLRKVMTEIGMEKLNDVIEQLKGKFAEAVNGMRKEKKAEESRVSKEHNTEANETKRKKDSREKAEELEKNLKSRRPAKNERAIE